MAEPYKSDHHCAHCCPQTACTCPLSRPTALDYIAVAPCGCVQGTISGAECDDGNMKPYATMLAGWLTSGYTIKRGRISSLPKGWRCGKSDCPFVEAGAEVANV